MMRERLKNAAATPQFKTLLIVGVQHLAEAALILSSIGIDVNELMKEALHSCQKQLSDATYEMTNLDELLNHAQAMGDEVAEKQSPEGPVTPRQTESDNSSKRDIGKSD